MNIQEISDLLEEAKIKPETRQLVKRLIDTLRQLMSEHDIVQIRDILSSGTDLLPGINGGGSIVVISGDGSDRCAPVILAIAKGRDARSRHGLPNVMREVRAHLIQCFEISEVVILLTDRWDADLMKESEPDFSAYLSRQFGRKVLIPIVSWKQQLTPYSWP